MASTTGEPASALVQPSISPLKHSAGSTLAGQISAAQAPLPNAVLESNIDHKLLKRSMPAGIELPALTGATAMAEERRQQEESQKATSLNPALQTKNELLGFSTSAPLSRAPEKPSMQNIDTSSPMTTLASTATAAEPMSIDGTTSTPVQTSPVSMTESDGAASRNALSGNVGNNDTFKRPASSVGDRPEERSNKALTYPPPISPEQESFGGRPRNMSYPTPTLSNTRSPIKKHKCPHCETDFTRHHNLKSHLLTHSQEKPYICTTCTAKFRRLHDLKRHTKLHTGERPHICNKCGRKFARGDALARHNKGPGGCAGRRGSGAEDDLDVSGMDEMDGVEFQGQGNLDDTAADAQRRKSEPNHQQSRSSAMPRTETGSSYRHSSTFPPVATMTSPGSAALAPAPAASSSNPPSSNHLTPASAARSSFSTPHYSQAASSYPQNGMTESPKPLSPGHVDPNRLGPSRGRSPSLTTQYQSQHFGRGSGRGGSPLSSVGLPPPNMPQPPQLPSLSGLTNDSRRNSYGQPQPQHGLHMPPGAPAHQPILSSQSQGGLHHHSQQHERPPPGRQSSGNSVQDILSQPPPGPPQQQDQVMEYIRVMEKRLREEMSANMRSQEQHYESKISRLQEEVNSLRGGQAPRSH